MVLASTFGMILGCWNNKAICNMFDDDTAARIFPIPLAGSNSEDLLV